ncbi:MAG: hypothetical protein HYY04_17555, partial [Chloroflexi bacterium]|nr:hypothetical protein [Chloroflexota bacterium]
LPPPSSPRPVAPPDPRPRVQIERRGERVYLVNAGRWDELVAVHGCWRAEEWWPEVTTRTYWRMRTRSGQVCTLSHDIKGWRLVEVLD